MEKEYEHKPLWRQVDYIVNRIKEVRLECSSADDSFDFVMGDDIERSSTALRERVRLGFVTEDPEDVLNQFGIARGKTGRLGSLMFSAQLHQELSQGDITEIQSALEDIRKDLTGIMKLIDPQLDEWKKDFPEIFGDQS